MTKQMIRTLSVCGLALACAAGASAQVVKQKGGYLFRMKYTKGHTSSYIVNSDTSTAGSKVHVRIPMKQKVESVSNGNATVSVSMGKMEMLVNGKPMNSPMPGSAGAGKKVTVVMDSLGRAQGGGAEQTSIALPEKPVPIGGTWTGENDVPTGMGAQPMHVSASYKFVGFQRVGSLDAAKLTFTLKGSGQMAISGTGTAWVSVADGSLIKNVSSMNMTMGSMSIPIAVTVIRG